MTVVEVGCGCGEFADIIINDDVNAIRYVGLEGSLSNASVVKSVTGYDAVVANFETPLPIPSNSADVVVTLEVIEHIANAEIFLRELSRILKPNGYLILSTPNVGFLGSRLKYLSKAEVLQEGIHLRFFNRLKLRSMTSAVGLHQVRQHSCMPWLGYNSMVRFLGLGSRRYSKTPQLLETLFATNFVWLLRKRD